MAPRAGIEPATYPLGGDRAIHWATGALRWNSIIFYLTGSVNHTKMGFTIKRVWRNW